MSSCKPSDTIWMRILSGHHIMSLVNAQILIAVAPNLIEYVENNYLRNEPV